MHTQDHGDALQRGGECCLHTLVDLKRKRSQRRGSSRTFSSRSNRSRRVTPAPPSSWHTYSSVTLLGLRSSKAPGREFRQHDGVVMILMFYYRRASSKHCNDSTEVEYGGGGHRTWLRNDLKDQLVCLGEPPCPRI